MAEQKPQKRSAFMAKLYKDDNELDEIKVLLGNQVDSDIDDKPIKPREIKAKSKISDLSKPSLISRIGRLVSFFVEFLELNKRECRTFRRIRIPLRKVCGCKPYKKLKRIPQSQKQ
jgi:hypothetical protein